MTDPPRSAPGLRRVIGTRTLTLSVVNFIVGSAIFVVPAAVAAQLGSTAVLGYLVAAALVLVVALCFAEAGSRVTATGGAYAYVERAFGPGPGFLVATLQWVANGVVGSGAVSNALVGTLAAVFPTLGQGVPRAALLCGLYGLFAWLNIRGARTGARTVVLLTVLKLAPLIVLLAVGLGQVDPGLLVWKTVPSVASLGEATLLLVFALTGMEIALTPTGEIRNPARTVPLAAVLGVGSAAALYVAIHLMAQGVLGDELARFTAAPLAEVAQQVIGPAGKTLLLVGATVSIIAFISGDFLSTPRTLFALADDRMLPPVLARIHPRFHTPHVAILVYGVLACGFALSGTFSQLALLNAIGVLLIYLGAVLAVFKLRRDRVEADRPPIALPGGPLVPIAALGLIAVLLIGSPANQQLAAALFVVGVTAFYLLWVRPRRQDLLAREARPRAPGAEAS